MEYKQPNTAVDLRCIITGIEQRTSRNGNTYFVVRTIDSNANRLSLTYWSSNTRGLEVGGEYTLIYQEKKGFKNLKLWTKSLNGKVIHIGQK